jgi:hypothetical protein
MSPLYLLISKQFPSHSPQEACILSILILITDSFPRFPNQTRYKYLFLKNKKITKKSLI